MPKPNRFCYTDNKAYYYCPSCPNGIKDGFNSMFCCERCSDIFKALTDETFKRITIKECKKELEKLNVSLEENFKDGIRSHIERIFSYVEDIKPVKSEIVENEITENEVVKEEVVDSEETIKIKHVSKKRTNKNSEVD